MTEDNLILAGLCKNDPAQFRTLLDKYGRYAAAVTAKVSSGRLSPQDLEEITSDVFIAVWKTAARINPQGATLKAYIGTIARNLTINALHKKNLTCLNELEEDTVWVPSSEDAYLEQEGTQLLEQLIAALPEPDREIFIRRYFYMERVMDIAGRFGMSDKAVSARIARMKQRLQELCLKEEVL